MTQRDIMVLGHELTEDGKVRGPVGIPKEVWGKHLLVAGETGSGKTTTMTRALTTANTQTDGPTIVLDPKGKGWLREIARAHYAQTGSLDDVLYFSVPDTFPAFSLFDIRRDMQAGISRGHAAENVADHFLEIVDHAKPAGFDAIRSPDLIEYFIKALFDEVHGHDAWAGQDLLDALYRFDKERVIPEVSDKSLEQALENLEAKSQNDLNNIIDGAITRVEKFAIDNYLRLPFNYVAESPKDAFAFDEWLTEDVFILIDISGPSERLQRILTNIVLSQLWQALQRRESTSRHEELPFTLLCVDEVPHLGIDKLLSDFLAMGREYGFGMIPILQFPRQLDTDGESGANEGESPYEEIITNCNSVLTGGIANDPEIVSKLSGSHMSEAVVQNRLNNLAPSRWFFQPASHREYGTIPSHIIAEPSLPPGHPDGPQPLSPSQQEAFDEAFGKYQQGPENAATLRYTNDSQLTGNVGGTPRGKHTPTGDLLLDELLESNGMLTLPLLTELPGKAMYEPVPGALVCEQCGVNRPASIDGLLDTLQCHGSLTDIDRAAIPPVELGLTMTANEIEAAPVSPRLLCALQIITNIAHKRYEQCEIDLVHDSPDDILDMFGVSSDDRNTLKEKGLITIHKLHKFSYYTVTPEGRKLLRQPHTNGVEWGHERGDNTESLLHIVMVEALYRYVNHEFVEDPASPIVTVKQYFEVQESAGEYDLDGETRFDLVGLDKDGYIRLIGEAERPNNDAARAAVRDYDQIATVGPDEAFWIVPSSTKGHEAVLTPLADPPAELGDQRIRSYKKSYRVSQMDGFDKPGMTGIFTLNEIRKQLPEPSLTSK